MRETIDINTIKADPDKTKVYKSLNYDERKNVARLLAAWLRPYTHEVVVKVLSHVDDILANEFSMKMIEELVARESKEFEDFTYSIGSLLNNFDGFKEYDPHNHPLEHSGSYRNVLYDLYIR